MNHQLLVNNKEIIFGQLIVPPYQDIIRKEIDESISKREPFKIEYEVVTKEGKRKWVYEKGQGIYEEDGTV
ncbi:MAG: PAS domain-containing protein [Sphaerochaetaceae bacterium]